MNNKYVDAANNTTKQTKDHANKLRNFQRTGCGVGDSIIKSIEL